MKTKFQGVTAALTLLASAAVSLCVSGVARASTLVDGGFESQGAASNIPGSYCYGGAGSSGENNCATGAWTFTTLVGGLVGDGMISQSTGGSPWNSSAWGAPIANDPSNYFAFVQINGSFSQAFTAIQTGTLSLDWIDAARSPNPGGGYETYTVSVTGPTSTVIVGTYTPTNSAFEPVSSASFSVIAGDSYTVTFQGVDPYPNYDRTAFIDNVALTPLPSTWTMLIAGFVGLGFFAYRGTKNSAATAAA